MTLLGCDAGPGADADALGDADVVDAGIAPADCVSVLTAGHLDLRRCGNGARYALWGADGPLLAEGSAAVEVEGRVLTTGDWPQVVWQRDGEAATARFFGLAGTPDLHLELRLRGGALGAGVRLVAAPGAAPVRVDGLTPLLAEGLRPGVGAPADWWSLPAAPGPRVAAAAAEPREAEQVVVAADGALLLGSADPGAGALVVTLAVAPDGAALGAAVSTREPPVELPGGAALASPVATLRPAATPRAALEAHADALAEDLGLPAARPALGWGWRSGPAYGALVNEALLVAQARALGELAAAEPLGPPWILADGLWFTALGDWEAAREAFPGGLAGAAAALGDARLAVRWPALRVTAAAEVFAARPEWRRAAADCPPATCGVLDPAIPGVRDHLARAAVALQAAGVDLALLADLTPGRASGDAALRDGTVAIRAATDLALIAEPYLPALAGVADGMVLDRLSVGSPGADCAAEALTGPFPRRAACVEALRLLTAADARPPTDPHRLRRRAFALAHRAHHLRRLSSADPGAVLVGPERTAGEARQGAALAALAGGLYLLGDDATRLPADRAAIFLAPLRAGPLGPGWPVDFGEGDDPPAVWVSPRALAIFNWGDAPRRFPNPAAHAPVASAATPVFPPEAGSIDLAGLDAVEVPAGDVVLWLFTAP